jgi:hypothetical protein
MLNDFLKKEISSIEENAKADIGAVKYVGTLVGKLKHKYSNPEMEKEIYSDLKDLMNKIYQTYGYEDEVLLDNAKNYRKREEMEKGAVLGLEKISGDPNVLDGAFDTGEILSLTSKGKKILNGYRLARGELTLEDERKDLHRRLHELSKEYCY